jgi:hypothetical protein
MILDFSDATDKFDAYEYVKTLHPKDFLSPSFISEQTLKVLTNSI